MRLGGKDCIVTYHTPGREVGDRGRGGCEWRVRGGGGGARSRIDQRGAHKSQISFVIISLKDLRLRIACIPKLALHIPRILDTPLSPPLSYTPVSHHVLYRLCPRLHSVHTCPTSDSALLYPPTSSASA